MKVVSRSSIFLTVVAGALGYFVDIFDLLLFNILRTDSLQSLGAYDITDVGASIAQWQLIGLAIGGVVWGILADKKGRITVLFSSIILYSLATFLNGSVTDVYQYKCLRFIAGIGLAGELGVGITLASEHLGSNKRGYGAMMIASIGCLGVIAAVLIAKEFEWRMTYRIGGILGFFILVLRFLVLESKIYTNQKSEIKKGSFLTLFRQRQSLIKYLRCILVGTPNIFCHGGFASFYPRIWESSRDY